jgi:hypothetical protein
MAESDNNGQAATGLYTQPQDWVSHIRQISVPVWARALALILSLAVLLPGIVLVWGGWLGCAEFIKDWLGSGLVCHEKWIAQGIEIVAAALLPVVVILYLVFAETGMRSLMRRTNELLGKIVPQALRSEGGPSATFSDGMESCSVATSFHTAGNISAHYLLQYRRENKEGALRFTVAVNIDKAVIVFFLPAQAETGPEEANRLMAPTIKGAKHEGYVFDEELVKTTREGKHYLQLIARRNLSSDFLWNPAAKLHFAWDLRSFAYSVIHDGHTLLQS